MMRNITNNDLPQLEDLDRRCFSPAVRYNRYAIDYYISLPNSIGLTEIKDNNLIGFIIALVATKESANIVTVDVDPRFRKQGIGSRLLQAVMGILKKWKITKITLQVSVDNTLAIKFYQKHGFNIMEILPNYYPTTDGYHMECILG